MENKEQNQTLSSERYLKEKKFMFVEKQEVDENLSDVIFKKKIA